MRFYFDFKKRHIFAIIGMIFFVGLVIAYGGNNPQVMGHSDGEIRLPALNQNLDAWSGSVESRFTNHENRITSLESSAGSCPSGMIDAGDFCIDSVKRSSGLGAQYVPAIQGCMLAGLHLCSGEEWIAGCLAIPFAQLPNWGGPHGEWAGGVVAVGSGNLDRATVYGYQPIGIGTGNCFRTYVGYQVNDPNPSYRCCKSQ